MDVPILRKLTWKSIINFGNYSGFTIQKIFDLGHTRYLRNIYYNKEGITFIDEILNAINIRSFDRIDKPGKDPEKCKYVNEKIFAYRDKTKKDGYKIMAHVKKMKKDYLLRKRKSESFQLKKGVLQAKNHGH